MSLLDSIPDDSPAGPWRLVTLADMTGPSPDTLWMKGGGMAKGQVFSRPVSLSPGSSILVRIAYNRPWGHGGKLVARLIAGGSTVASASAELGRSWAEVWLPSVGATEGWLQIGHLGVRERIPLRSMVVLEVRAEATTSQLERARTLAAWAAREQTAADRTFLVKRKARLARASVRRNAVALSSGDTLTFDVPRRGCRWSLRFSLTGLRLLPESASVLAIECLDGHGWHAVANVACDDLDKAAWQHRHLGACIPASASALRFVLTGRDEVLAVGSPIIIAERTATRSRPNVILIDLDTMRADRLGSYGYTERPTSARLDSLLAARGFAVFRHAYSAGPWTLPATAKFMTSRYHNIERNETLPRGYTTLAEMLRSAGYYCVAFTGGGVLRFPGFEQGFHRYFWSEELGDTLGKVETVFPRAEEWLRCIDLAPFFLFVHTYEPHTPYTRDVFCRELPHGRLGDLTAGEPLFPEDLFASRRTPELTPEESLYVQAAYDGGVRVACDATVNLLSILDERDLWKNTIVVILSDHGEEFWEHSPHFADHPGTSVYGELINVPFILYDPRHASSGVKVIDTAASTVDLLPTIAGVTGIDPPKQCDGINLAPLLRGRRVTRRIPIMALTEPGEPSTPVRGTIIADGLKYHEALGVDPEERFVYPAQAQLYDLRRDPREKVDLASSDPATARQMEQRLRRGLSEAAPVLEEAPPDSTHGPDQGLREQLRALGYLRDE